MGRVTRRMRMADPRVTWRDAITDALASVGRQEAA
ncbi:MAG: hypothetical protein ACI9K2_001009 [Myxococcota bacterium]|jgi:hypothetical protein